jgi:GTP-binding protein LepA
MKYLTDSRTTLVYNIPLAEVVTDYFDMLKSRSKVGAQARLMLSRA